MQQRYYDPRIGRFLSVDPVTVSSAGANFNRYSYANDNPYRFTDPDGRYGFDRHSRKFKIPQNSFKDFLGDSAEFFSSTSRSGATHGVRKLRPQTDVKVGPVSSEVRARGRELTQPYVNPAWSDEHYEVGPTFITFTGGLWTESDVADAVEWRSVPFTISPKSGEMSVLFQPIRHYREGNVSLNITRPGHRWHSGGVIHATYAHGGAIWIYTRGVENGPNQLFNAAVGISVFGKMHGDFYDFFNPASFP